MLHDHFADLALQLVITLDGVDLGGEQRRYRLVDVFAELLGDGG
jgi:hypothetical protein